MSDTTDILRAPDRFAVALHHHLAGRHEQAEQACRQMLAIDPEHADSIGLLGMIARQRGHLDLAVEHLRQAATLAPSNASAHSNLGIALAEQGKVAASAACYRHALKLNPNFTEAHNNLGALLQGQDRLDEAVACYRAALVGQPLLAELHRNLASALREQVRFDEAIASYRQALALRPDFADAHYELGLALLAKGDLATAWPECEWRWQTQALQPDIRRFTQPQWRGETTENGTLLIYAEQGFGDTLQFARFAEQAAERGWRVIMEVPPALRRLAASAPGVAQVVVRGEALPPFDCQCAMLSLPLALQTVLQTIPATVPYLVPDAAALGAWRRRLDSFQEIRVGLAWAGSPRMAPDRRRSIPPQQLAPLFDIPGIRFFSLQKLGPTAPAQFALTDVMGEMSDFADTAALVVNLDLVIAVDSAVAHLAGALGVPVWLLNRFDACWRWLPGLGDGARADTPWYPNMRLFRQPAPGDWASVLRNVATALRGLVTPTPPPPPLADVSARLATAWAHHRAGRLQEAEALCREILAADRRHDAALHLLGLLACTAGQTRQGIRLIRQAIRRNPSQLTYQANLGAALLQVGALEEAALWSRRIIAHQPNDAQAHNALGAALREQGRKQEAIACFHSAIRCQPDLAEAHYNLSRGLLACGDFAAGWSAYEWRWQTAYFRRQAPALAQARWHGEPASGQTVLLHAEQGFGDTLQFCRYAPLVAARGLRTVLEVPAPLARLLRSLSGVAEVVPQGETRPDFDLHCPMMSLPLAFGTTLTTIPANIPYLRADPVAVAHWRARLDNVCSTGLRVGLAWAGAPSITVMDRQRSIAPELLAPLLTVPNLHFVSLQKDGPRAPFPLTDVMDEMTDFADTAALITNLDVVIAVDTAVAHLAGALGKPVWMLDRFDPCWRWLSDRTTSPLNLSPPNSSPWYPKLRIYRQSQSNEWGAVVAAVVQALRAMSP